jgi:hypothetical protein
MEKKKTGITACEGVYSGSVLYGWWWLRSPGFLNNCAAYVGTGGSVRGSGGNVSNEDGVVRPVVVLRLSQPNP